MKNPVSYNIMITRTKCDIISDTIWPKDLLGNFMKDEKKINICTANSYDAIENVIGNIDTEKCVDLVPSRLKTGNFQPEDFVFEEFRTELSVKSNCVRKSSSLGRRDSRQILIMQTGNEQYFHRKKELENEMKILQSEVVKSKNI